MRSVKNGRKQANGAKRGKAASKSRGATPARRLPRLLMMAGVMALVGVGASAVVMRASLGTAFEDVAASTLRGLGATVQDVTVTGRRNAPSKEIFAALNVDRGVSMLTFDAQRARARVMDIDWVENATVSRLFPDTILVTLTERVPFAVWQRSGRDYVIDAKGETITEASSAVKAQLPYLVGVGAPAAAPKLLAMLELRPSIRNKVQAAVRVGDRRWTLRLNQGTDVMLPARHIEVALDELIRLDDSVELLSRDVALVDLRIPDRLTVKARGDVSDSQKDDAKT